jgi:hypothetical protein
VKRCGVGVMLYGLHLLAFLTGPAVDEGRVLHALHLRGSKVRPS